ncbi:TonB-dependent receptor [Sphingomonas sp.]|jgi:iron complex outermembrane receptor protein|uniref:TonB-dependent receptor n=1 Tax=Sphingomonas sp. TaxID=28214 RepID=UPI0025EAFBEA|nr:TonB-dependent receptor [Sphingomonas sp.]
MNARSLTRLLGGVAIFAVATPALAQTASEDRAQATNAPTGNSTDGSAPEEIIVTATKRASTLQNVPFSINAQTQADLQRANAVTLEDVSRNIAGLAVQNLGPGQSQVSIRGVSAGQIVRDQPGVKEQVGVYLDESVVSLSLFTPDFDLFDLNRVETLRGPQGTLFGSGSVGGTIRYITNQPKLGKTEGLIEANVNTMQEDAIGGWLKGAVNLPLGPTAALRVVGYGTRYAGFIDAIGPAAKKNVNSGSRVGGRASILWEPASGVKLTPRIVYQDIKANGFNREEVFNLYSNQFTTPSHTYATNEQYLNLRESFRDKTTLADLTASADLSSNVEVTSVTSYIHRNILVSRDASALTGSVSVDLGFPTAGVNLPSNLVDTTKVKQFSQELRVGSTGPGPFQWVIGGFYSHVDRQYTQRLPTPGYDAFTDARFGAGTSVAVANGFPLNSPYNADLPYKIKQTAIFGEASYKTGDFKVTAGGRYYDFKEKRTFKSGGLFANGDNNIDRTKSSGFSPRLIATYAPDRNLSVNLQASKGFRLGGVNDPLNIPLCSGGAGGVDALTYGNHPRYNDETLWNYEGGIKTQGHGLTFNAAAFYTRIKNLQVTADAGSCSSRVVFNVPKAHTQGIEAELSARPIRGLDLALSGSFINSKFDSSVTTTSGTVIAGIRDGNRLPTVPKFQVSASATYGQRFSSNADWYVSASYQHVGTRFTQPSDQENNPRTFISGLPFNGATGTGATVLNLKLPSYDLVDISAGLKFNSGTEFVLYAKNLFDETPLLSFDRERGGRARLGFNVGQPRNIGLTVRQAF